MANREIDYYIKNLPFDVRQEIFRLLDEINSSRVKELLEKPEGYPSFKSMGYSPEKILKTLQQSSNDFKKANNYMMENERYPLFGNPEDTYQSSLEYVEILRKKTEEELLEKFGCAWEEYVPRVLKKNKDREEV